MADGARLQFAVSFRVGCNRTKLSLLATLFLALLALSCHPRIDFARQGLPADLSDHLGRLRILKLPPSVSRLDWLPLSLIELDASYTLVSGLPYLPPKLQRLNVSYAKNLAYLPPNLPKSLEELDIRFTGIRGPWNFEHLEVLHLGGDGITNLQGLSKSLLELSIEDARIRTTAGLPQNLQSLSISGTAVSETNEPLLEDIGRLPPRLKELHLSNTLIKSLKVMPRSVQSLTLINNPALDVELPVFLLSLTIGGAHQKVSPIDDLEFLTHLDIRNSGGPSELPIFLRDLRLRTIGPWASKPITSSLKRFWITSDADSIVVLPPLPDGLEDLRWPYAQNSLNLPGRLKYLHLPFSPLSDLSSLRQLVHRLDVTGAAVEMRRLPRSVRNLRFRACACVAVSGLPPELRSLDLSGSRDLVTVDLNSLSSLTDLDLSETALAKIPALPSSLRKLDISNTAIDHLENLPEGLLSLTVHEGQLRSLSGLPDSVTELYFLDHQ